MLQLVFPHHSHEARGGERGLEVRMSLLVADSESGLLVNALRCDVADQDRKLCDAMAAGAAGSENLSHKKICQSAAKKLGQRGDRFDHPCTVERVEGALPHRRGSIGRRFLVRSSPTFLALDIFHRVGQHFPSACARIEAAQRRGWLCVMFRDDETRVVAERHRLCECEPSQVVEAVFFGTAGNQIPYTTLQMAARREHHHSREKDRVVRVAGANLRFHLSIRLMKRYSDFIRSGANAAVSAFVPRSLFDARLSDKSKSHSQ